MKIIPFSLNKDTTISYWRYIDDYSLFDATILKGHMNGYIFIDDDKVFSIKTIESPMIHLFEKRLYKMLHGWVYYTYLFEASSETVYCFKNGYFAYSYKLSDSEAERRCIREIVNVYAYMVHSLFIIREE